MKKNRKCLLLALIFTVLCLPRVSAQHLDTLLPLGEFPEKLHLAYSFYHAEGFELFLDEQGTVMVKSECDNHAEIQNFVAAQSREYKRLVLLPKEDFGALNIRWSEGLPEAIYAALVKQENLRAAAQNNLCSYSEPFCTDNGLYQFPAGVNAGSGEPGPYYSCLGRQPNPAWYYLRILDPGDMDIYMYSTPLVDIDFCCWGPFDNPLEPCPDGLSRSKVVSCSYLTDPAETCEIRGAEHGEYYILLITNYSNRPCNINFSKVAGDATTDCDILPPLVSYDAPICEGHDLNLFANGSLGDTFHWFFVNGTWTSDDQNPVRHNATRDMSGTYGCVISRDGMVSDTTYIEVIVGENTHYYFEEEECDSFFWEGEEYTESGVFTFSLPTASGCDSIIDLSVTINHSPGFEVEGNHWPIGGSEINISVNEYAIALDNPQVQLDTVIWEVDCDNWRIEPHGKGETMTLYIYTFLLEPVMLHATAFNMCGSNRRDFFLQTSYFDMDETIEDESFTVSPNPTDGNLTLHFGDLSGKAEIAVYTTWGGLLHPFTQGVNFALFHPLSPFWHGLCYSLATPRWTR